MDRFPKILISASLIFFALPSIAGYAQLAAPPGWAPTPVGGAIGTFNYGAAANTAKILSNGTVATNAALNVGGKAVQIPVAMRFAANASKFAASAVFINPYLAAGVAVASWLASSKISWSDSENKWIKEDPDSKISDGYEYALTFNNMPEKYSIDKQEVCDGASKVFFGVNFLGANYSERFARVNGDYCVFGAFNKELKTFQDVQYKMKLRNGSCPAGWYITPAGCSMLPPPKNVNEEEFLEALRKSPMPSRVPVEVPVHLPVEQPMINPAPDGNPQHRPVFIPTGDPVPNPNYDPSKAPSPQNQPYLRPGVQVTPSPTPENPWQVDIKPVDLPSPDSKPNPNPETDISGDPQKPSEKPGLCDEYPDILACAKLDKSDSEDLKEKILDIQISQDSGWGGDNAVCPQPKVIHPLGQTIQIPYDLFCLYMNGMRPIIIAMAWLSAAFILLGARESS